MNALYSALEDVDPAITRSDRSKDCLARRPKLKEFMMHCCHERKYVFAVKKCGKHDCDICKPTCLPSEVFNTLYHILDPTPDGNEHYKPFSEL